MYTSFIFCIFFASIGMLLKQWPWKLKFVVLIFLSPDTALATLGIHLGTHWAVEISGEFFHV